MKESDLAKKAIEYFEKEGFEVFQEVQLSGYGSRVVDIVLKKDNILWGIEIKKNLSLALLDQGWRNLRYFNKSAIVFSKSVNYSILSFKRSENRARNFAFKIAEDYGIGLFQIEVDKKRDGQIVIWEPESKLEPKLIEKPVFKDSIFLCDRHKSFAEAGNSNGKRWTPFQATKENLIKYIKKNEGCKLRNALQNIEHHYSSINSGVSCLSGLIKNGIIKELNYDKGKLFLE